MTIPSAIHIPEGQDSGWSIERRVVSEEEAEKEAAVARILADPRPTVRAGTYTVLCRDGRVWMSDSEPEIADHDRVVWEAHNRGGRVLVHGLGLGLILHQMLTYSQGAPTAVEHIDVVEREPAIIRLVAPSLVQYAGRLTIHQGDCRSFPWPPDARWSVVWHDIWSDITQESRRQAAALERVFSRRCDWQASWGGAEADAAI